MENTKKIKIVTADPSALGLFGLAIITLVASSLKLGLTSGVSLVFPWAIFLGATAQLFACINDFKHDNTFGATGFGEKLAQAADPKQLGFAFLGYLIFTAFMTIGSMETNKVLFIIFVLIDLLFIGLALDSFGIMSGFSHSLAAWAELLIAIMSFYGSGACVLNKHFGREFLPVGKPFGIFKK